MTMEEDYEDNYWLEDAIFMERNSRDFVSRIQRININAEAICDVLKSVPIGTCHAEPAEARVFYVLNRLSGSTSRLDVEIGARSRETAMQSKDGK